MSTVADTVATPPRVRPDVVRKRRYRARLAQGRVVVPVVVDEVELIEVLRAAEVPLCDDPSREDLARGIERLIDDLARDEERVPSSSAAEV